MTGWDALPRHGVPADQVIAEVAALREGDLPTHGGRLFVLRESVAAARATGPVQVPGGSTKVSTTAYLLWSGSAPKSPTVARLCGS
jgi:hypothetical protein